MSPYQLKGRHGIFEYIYTREGITYISHVYVTAFLDTQVLVNIILLLPLCLTYTLLLINFHPLLFILKII
jgi:hypothetical protein